MSQLMSISELNVFPRSVVVDSPDEFGMARTTGGPRLAVLVPSGSPILNDFDGECTRQDNRTLLLGPLTARNALALRARLAWLRPQALGLRTSAGMGDRLGLATPGHVQAVRASGLIAPIFAQQSIREMTRTGRSPQQVMDDATWGIFEEGWKDGVGADADHQKTTADVDSCLRAGFTFFTVDPGEHVDNSAETATLPDLRDAAERLPADLNPGASGLQGKTFDVEGHRLNFDEHTLLKAAVK